MGVDGALMWSLGKVMQTPEVCRVYIGSFWEAPLSNFENRFLLEVCVRDVYYFHFGARGKTRSMTRSDAMFPLFSVVLYS